MPQAQQSRLLRVLQEREVRRVGDNTPFHVNVRVLAATNEPLEKKMKEGAFREDLYYRLNVIPIPLPSVRERREDIPLLVAHFLKSKVNPRTQRCFQLTRHAMDVLCAYDWPGNVRELENAIERAATLCEGEIIQASDLPPNIVANTKTTVPPDAAAASLPDVPESALYPLHLNNGPAAQDGQEDRTSLNNVESLKDFMRQQEQTYLTKVMEQCGGDKEKAALLLGVSLATLYRKLSGEEKE